MVEPKKDVIIRDEKGRFVPGICPTKSPGRPAVARDFRLRCREFMEKEGWPLVEEMARDKNHRDHSRAIELLTAYAYGKPAMEMALTGAGGKEVIWKVIYDTPKTVEDGAGHAKEGP